jgi:putative intracellular protease/amidase
MNAFPIPSGFGTRQEMHDGRLHEFIHSLPEKTLVTSACTGSAICGVIGLLDGKPATNRKEPDRLEASNFRKIPIDRLAEIAPACRIRVVDAGRIITAGGIASGALEPCRELQIFLADVPPPRAAALVPQS